MSFWLSLYAAAAWIIVIASFALTPRLSNSAVSFGVTVPEAHRRHPDVLRVRRQFTLAALVLGILLAALSFVLGASDAENFAVATIAGLNVYIAAALLVYYRCHAVMRRLKAEQNWEDAPRRTVVMDTRFRERLTSSPILMVLPYILFVVTIAGVALYYGQIPDRIPLHYDASGTPDRFGDKSFGNIFGINIVQFVMILVMHSVREIIIRSKQQLNPAAPEASRSRNTAFRRENLLLIQWLNIALTLLFSIIQLSIIAIIPPAAILPAAIVLPFAPLVIFLIRIIRLGGSGSLPVGEDRHWRLGGSIYVNPDDPALFVEKRIGAGYTVNFGRPAGWLMMIGLLLTPILIIVIIELAM